MTQGRKATHRIVAPAGCEEDEQAKREIASLAAAVRRAQSALVDPSFSRDCWIDHGEQNLYSPGPERHAPRCSRGHEKYWR